MSSRRGSPILSFILIGLFISALGLTVYQAVTASGLYELLAGLQAEYVFSGAYYPLPTFLVTLLVFTAPLFLVARLLAPVSAGAVDDRAVVAELRDDPSILTNNALQIGRAGAINWPEASMTFRDDGIMFERGKWALLCPWRLFAVPERPVGAADGSLVLPIDPRFIDDIELWSSGKREERLATPFFRFQGERQIELHVDYGGPIHELGDAIQSVADELTHGGMA